MKTATIHARIEPDTKEKAEKVLRKLGLTPTEAIRIFYRQICLGNGLPFPVEIPNKRTVETLEKSQRGEEVKEFDTLDEMFDTWPSHEKSFSDTPVFKRSETDRQTGKGSE